MEQQKFDIPTFEQRWQEVQDILSRDEFTRYALEKFYLRHINGHTVISAPVKDGYNIWMTKPNRSDLTFAFLTISQATLFCRQYENNHSNNFWFTLWMRNPIYRLKSVWMLAVNDNVPTI